MSTCEYVDGVEEDAPSLKPTVAGLGLKDATIKSAAALYATDTHMDEPPG